MKTRKRLCVLALAGAVALDAGLVPEGERANVLTALVENIYAYQPFGGGPHFSGGTIGLAPVVRALLEGGRSTSCGTSCKRTHGRATGPSCSRRPRIRTA